MSQPNLFQEFHPIWGFFPKPLSKAEHKQTFKAKRANQSIVLMEARAD